MRPTIILIADDDTAIIELLEANFGAEGWETFSAFNGDETIKLIHEKNPDLVILDIGMPGISGVEICRHIAAVSTIPVIMLTGRRDEETRSKCLSLGAEGYVTKPFRPKQLVEEVKAVLLRRRAADIRLQHPLVCGQLEVDFTAGKVTFQGNEIHLTQTEYYLLEELALNAGKTLTTGYLLNKVWGPKYSDETRFVHDYVDRLRAKIEPQPDSPIFIVTVPGTGYRMKGKLKAQN